MLLVFESIGSVSFDCFELLKIKIIWNISKAVFIKIATNSYPFYFHVLGDHKGSFQTESKDMDNGYAIRED